MSRSRSVRVAGEGPSGPGTEDGEGDPAVQERTEDGTAQARGPRGRLALLIALGIDNFGSGLFLPLTLVYTTRIVGLSVATAGVVLAVGTGIGLVVPAITGRLVDRLGPRVVVITAQLVQGAGVAAYLFANGLVLALVAAVLLAAGVQMFYSALLSLISDVSPDGPKDRSFALVSMVRSGAFGAGALGAGILLSVAGHTGLRVSVGADVLTYLLAATLLWRFVSPVPRSGEPETRDAPSPKVLRNPSFLMLIMVAGLIALAGDFFLVGMPLYGDSVLHLPSWVTGASFAVLTGITSLGGTTAVRMTNGMKRTVTMAIGVVLILVWCGAMLGVAWLPHGQRAGFALLLTVVFALGSLLCDSRTGAMAEAAAPPAQRGVYLAAFQYSFAFAQLLAPLLAGLFSLGHWVPWGLVAVSLLAGLGLLTWLDRHLPAHAVRATAAVAADEA